MISVTFQRRCPWLLKLLVMAGGGFYIPDVSIIDESGLLDYNAM
jgi:hypothetical protein